MRHFIAVAALLTAAPEAFSAPIEEDFESASGYTNGSSLDTYTGWTITGGSATISTTESHGGTQSVKLVATGGSVAVRVDRDLDTLDPSADPYFKDFWIKPVASPSSSALHQVELDGIFIGFVKSGTTGQVVAIDGDGADGDTPGDRSRLAKGGFALGTGDVFSNWVRITVRQHFAENSYDVYVDGSMVLKDLGIDQSESRAPGELVIHGDTDEAVYVDDLEIAATNPLFTDTDTNGIDDSWGAGSMSREGDADTDGFSNIEEYIAGTNASSDASLPNTAVYVATTGSNLNSGTKASPYLTIQYAVDQASDGDRIVITAGTYTGTGNRDVVFSNGDDYHFRGAGIGQTTIDLESAAGAFTFDDGQTEETVIEGMTILDGDSNPGVIEISNGSEITIRDCEIESSDSRGIYVSGSDAGLYFDASRLEDGSVAGAGGGLTVWGSGGWLVVRGSEIVGNVVTGSGGDGGGMWIGDPSYAVITNTLFSENTATVDGGAIHLRPTSGEQIISNCRFEWNESTDDGAAIYVGFADPTITGSEFEHNFTAATSGSSGGAIYMVGSDAEIDSCLFDDNASGHYGGAIHIKKSDPTITNSAIVRNEAVFKGAGISSIEDNLNSAFDSSATIVNCTIAHNKLKAWHVSNIGGLYIQNDGTKDNVINTTVFYNFPSEISGYPSDIGSRMNVHNCNVQWPAAGGIAIPSSGTTITNNINVHPRFAGDGYHVREDSPDLGLGATSAGGVTAPDLDIDGEARGSGAPDIGADQFVDTDGDGMPEWFEWTIINANDSDSIKSPADVDPDDDFDTDGVQNGQEYRNGTNAASTTQAEKDADAEKNDEDNNLDPEDPQDPSDEIRVVLGVGDESSSKSEYYQLEVYETKFDGTDPDSVVHTVDSGGQGQYSEQSVTLNKATGYAFRIKHVSSAQSSPDYDYSLQAYGSAGGAVVVDPYFEANADYPNLQDDGDRIIVRGWKNQDKDEDESEKRCDPSEWNGRTPYVTHLQLEAKETNPGANAGERQVAGHGETLSLTPTTSSGSDNNTGSFLVRFPTPPKVDGTLALKIIGPGATLSGQTSTEGVPVLLKGTALAHGTDHEVEVDFSLGGSWEVQLFDYSNGDGDLRYMIGNVYVGGCGSCSSGGEGGCEAGSEEVSAGEDGLSASVGGGSSSAGGGGGSSINIGGGGGPLPGLIDPANMEHNGPGTWGASGGDTTWTTNTGKITYPSAITGSGAGTFPIKIYDESGTTLRKTLDVYNPTNDPNLFTMDVYDGSHTTGTLLRSYEYAYTPAAYQWAGATSSWTLKKKDGTGTVLTEQIFTSVAQPDGGRVVTEEIKGLNGATSQTETESVEERTYRLTSYGEVLVQRTVSPSSTPRTWTYQYYGVNAAGVTPVGAEGRLRLSVSPDGDWSYYEYNADGRLTKEVSRYLDLNAINGGTGEPTDGVTGAGRIREVTYSGTPTEVRTVEKIYDGTDTIEVSKRYRKRTSATEAVSKVATAAGAGYTATSNLTTTTTYYADNQMANSNRVKSVAHPDGTLTTYDNEISGDDFTTTVKAGAASGGVVTDGTETTTEKNVAGYTTSQTTEDIDSGITLSDMSVTSTDAHDRPTAVSYLDGSTSTRAYAVGSCCGGGGGGGGLEWEIGRDGVKREYEYDGLGRTTSVKTYHRGAGNNPIEIETEYDAAGRAVKSTRIPEGGGAGIVTSRMEYDAYGDVLWSEDGLGNRTDYSTSVSATGTVRTTTYPEDDNSVSGTRVVSTYPDGSAKLVEGTAAVPMKYTYEPIAGNKEERTVIRLRDDDNNSTWEEDEGQVTTYVMGRVTKSGSLGVDPTETFYNALGQVVRVVDPDGVETLYEYDSRGRRAKSAINMNPIDDDIDEDGTDRITSWEYYYGEDDIQPGNANDIPFMRTTTKVWATNNTDSSVVVSISESGTDGLFSATRRDSTGPNTTVTRKTGSAATITQVLPSGMKRVTETSYGRTTAVKELDSSSAQLTKVDYAYDSHGRLSSTTDARKGATTYTYNANDQVATMVAPDPDGAGSLTTRTTTYTYDDLGRATQITHPDGTTTIREYDLAGRVIEVSGTRELNIEYGYDAQGRRVSMTTHGDGGMGDQETTWTYNDEGQLSSKEDDDSEDVTYTYTDAGRLDVRTWARGVTTTYGYDAGGLLTDVDYSGTTTTNLDISYTRDGLRDEIDDSQGKRKFTYDSRRLPEFEIIDGTALDLRHTRKLDSLDRNEGWELESGTVGTSWAFNSPSSAAENTYGYESGTGRFEKLWDNDGTGASDYTYHYGLSNSHLVTQIDRPQKKVVFAYLAGADLLSSMLNYTNTYYQSAFSYGYDDSLQRKHCVYYGAGFIASHSGIWYWDYDSKGQIDNFERVLSDKWAYPYASGATRWTEDERDYDFDGIGNREEVVLTETPGGATPATVTTTDYDVNALNQYTAIGGTSRPTPHHDDDGNLIDDGTLEYEWDAENRLIEVIDGSTSNTIAEYEYDYMGRRWRKETTSSAPQGATETIFAYDGWNLIAEYDASGTPTVLRTYAWGLDLSGTLQGAGGVGGLMQVERHDLSPNEIWYYNYDGNGNVSEVVNSAEYRYAHYEYSPFGETVEKTYSWADDNPFRFSTKYFDEETGWLYYGYRYLDPENGRWSSRDPIGERGGNNLNGFVGNDGPNNWDNLGLAPGDEFTGATALADTINDARSHLRKEALAIFKSGKKKLKSHIGTAPQNAGSADLAGVADAADVDFAFWKAHDRHYKSVAGREIGGGIYCIKKGGTKYSYNVYIPTTKYSLPATVAFEDFPKIEKHKNHKSDSVSWLDFLHTHSAAEYSHTPSGATVGSGYGLSEPDYKFPHIPEDVLPEFNFRNQPIWAIDFFVDTYYDPRGSYPDMPSSRPISSPRPPNLPGTDGVIDSREEFQLR